VTDITTNAARGVTLTPRDDLFVTTALKETPALVALAQQHAAELGALFVPRDDENLVKLFQARPAARRALIAQAERLLLADRDGHELFYHPNMAAPRLRTILSGGRDLLLEAAALSPGDSVLDCTLGYAAEAILCAHVVGDTGEVHGIEAVPELGLVVREGLQTVVTDQTRLTAALRRVRVVHLGHHLSYLEACPTDRYDVVCFDPFFGELLPNSENFSVLRAFGDHDRLSLDAVREACRVARRRVVIKSARKSPFLGSLGVTEIIGSNSGKVVYGVLNVAKNEI